MKKAYIQPKSRLMGMAAETLFAGSPTNPSVSEEPAEVSGGSVIMEGRETISAPDAWEEW